MKNLTLSLLLILLIKTASAQAVLEHTYTDAIIFGPFKTTNQGWIYASVHYGTQKDNIFLYNSSHILFKTIPLQLPIGYTFYMFMNVSDNLFNSDNKLEVLYSISGPSDSKMIIKNEDGTTIQEFPKQYYARIVNLDGNFKMITSSSPLDSNVYIYALPGTMVDIPEQIGKDEMLQAFPNPCSDYLNVPAGSFPSEITILSLSGSIVQSYMIQGPEQSRIDIRSLIPGSYIYRCRSASGNISSGKFTVIR